jgi:ribosome biogenesis GTPase
LGSSGVGKTTLLNKLLGEALFDVNDVREKDSKGRHTTSRRQLVRLQSGSIFIDTPGMREVGNFSIDAGLEETFDEIAALQGQCHFGDCTHTHETGCAVIEAVQQGLIDKDRYEHYLMIQKESTFYSMSYLEKKEGQSFWPAFKKLPKNATKKIALLIQDPSRYTSSFSLCSSRGRAQ